MTIELPLSMSAPIDLHGWDNRLLILAAIVTATLVGYFIWEYLREWRQRRAFRRSCESTSRREF